ncbi:MFS transporter [Dyadobacter sp. NIV53]|uniref:MFS transporter n=1 Tax=Dyadobacter sp. NIV53 TaxID=2861765 RepID=UPI001C88858A|nr:MFS transporter [Dyadobacter sp. NIV53]
MSNFNETLTLENSLSRKWLVFALCMLSYLFTGMVSTLVSVYLPVAVPELTGSELPDKTVTESRLGEIGAYVNASYLYGWMVGGLLFGLISDKIGRVQTLTFVTILYGAGTCLVVFVPDWYSLMAIRFITGMGVGGVLLVSTVYISEVWEPATRPVMLGVLAVSFPMGIVATGSVNLMFSYWREAFWLGLIPIFLGVLILFLVPESQQWRFSKSAGAVKSEGIFDQTNRPNLIIGSIIFGAVLIGLWGIFSWLPTWVQSLLGSGENGQKERGLTMIILGMGGITGGVLSGFLIKAIGSRRTLILTFSGCILMCCILFLTNHHFSKIIYAEAGLLSLCFGVSQGSLSSYIPGLFPVVVRATATGFCFNIGRFFTATAVFFIGSLVAVLGGFGNALLVFSIPFLLALVITWFSRDPQTSIK